MTSNFPSEYFSSEYEVCERRSCVPGYQIYKDVWDVVIAFGKELQCERKPDTNRSDWYAVTIKRWDNHRSSATINIMSLFLFSENRK